MEYYKKYFTDVTNWEQEEVKVLCPFHDDNNPSASINTEKDLFHCFTCDVGYDEVGFASRINDISLLEATKLLDKYNYIDDFHITKGKLWADEQFLNKVRELGLSDQTIDDMNLGLFKDETFGKKFLAIPVYYNKMLVDVRKYNLLKYKNTAKLYGTDSKVGFIIPYDSFKDSNEACYILEGEKDMLMARELGINAYTLTGGAGASPNEFTINAFKNKDIILCYDNDEAGKGGMLSLFEKIHKFVKSVKYVDIGEIVKENKEDFYDAVHKYKMDVLDFYALEQKEFNINDLKTEKIISIKNALDENNINKKLKSIVTVTSEFADSYSIPTIVEFIKMEDNNSKKDTMFKDEKKMWYFKKEENLKDMLELIEVSAKDIEVKAKLRSYVGISPNEPNISINRKRLETVYKSTVVDKDFDGSAISLDLYSFTRLDVGGQYLIEYNIFSHPTKHQKVIAVCTNASMIHDNRNYTINKEKLSKFQIEGTVKERLDYLYQSARHHIAPHLNYNLWLMQDLVFNSILDFEYTELMRGALDVFILGDSQTGKSETATKLVELYNFGHFLTLKTSTTVGLIGGSSKVEGTYCNTIGSIPRQHKRLVVLEEFSGARQDFIKTMTDIRSSNILRLSRVSGELIVPCKLRMITTSNPINDENGQPRNLATFPNGIIPLMELVKSAEDIARYDGFLLIRRITDRINPFVNKLVGIPISKENYENKINWIATRQPENIIISNEIKSYIWEKAEELNNNFECNFPIFGVVASKKLARFCVALAALIVNVDESYENIIVTKEIVDYMYEFLYNNYNSESFKLREYADEYKSYNSCDDNDVKVLQSIFSKNATLINFISTISEANRSSLMSVSGLEGSKFYPVFNKLIANKFIRMSLDRVYPTDKFRKAYNKLDTSFTADTGSLIEEVSSGVTFINDLSKGDGNDES